MDAPRDEPLSAAPLPGRLLTCLCIQPQISRHRLERSEPEGKTTIALLQVQMQDIYGVICYLNGNL